MNWLLTVWLFQPYVTPQHHEHLGATMDCWILHIFSSPLSDNSLLAWERSSMPSSQLGKQVVGHEITGDDTLVNASDCSQCMMIQTELWLFIFVWSWVISLACSQILILTWTVSQEKCIRPSEQSEKGLMNQRWLVRPAELCHLPTAWWRNDHGQW